MPFCYFTLSVENERFAEFTLAKRGLAPSPRTLGEHLRNRRLRLGLRQVDVAARLGAVREVYDRWERDVREPVVSEWPEILAFLGTYPFPEKTPADLVIKARRCQGADQKFMAKKLGVIHQRLRRWEQGQEELPNGAEVRLRELAKF